MSQLRVYINTFDDRNVYSGFVEYTNDTDESSLQRVSQKLDNNQFDVGVYKNTNFNLALKNDDGKFSEVGVTQSIFISKRIDSIVKITWQNAGSQAICGIAICGDAILGDEKIIFYGLLNDIATFQNIRDQKIKFSCQGLESIFQRVETNYSSLNGSDTISDIIYDLLNQTEITNLMTVSAGNISVGQDQVPDSIADLEESTVKEALDKLLEMSNSVIYVSVDDQTVYVKPRSPGATVDYIFYGQASNEGSENIIDIKNVKTGLNRTFNFWKWTDTTNTSKDQSSIDMYGVRKKEIDSSLFTNTTKIENILTDYKDEFANPKQELKLTSILDNNTVDLFLLDKVQIDYPTVFDPAPDSDLPLYGKAVYGTDKYPFGQWNLTIDSTKSYKILGRSVDLKNNLITFDLREI